MQFIKNLWCGDLPLVRTYWVFGVGVGICLKLASVVAMLVAAVTAPFGVFAAVLIGTFAAVFGHQLFIAGAIWRSASRYTGRPIWRVLAKTAVVLGLLSIPNEIASLANQNVINDESLRRQSAIVNRNVPRMIDQATRFDSMTVEPKELVYHYTMITKRASDIEGDVFLHAMRSNMQRHLCGSEEKFMQSVMRNNISVSYSFDGMDAQPIGKVTFVAADCLLSAKR